LIGDFGISQKFDEGENEGMMLNKNGSPSFTAPEACSSKSLQINGKSLDVWSLGVTLYCFVHGNCPFEVNDDNIFELYRKITHDLVIYNDDLSYDLKDLLGKMLEREPSKRITIPCIKEHSWTTLKGKDPMMSTEKNCYMYQSEESISFKPVRKFVQKVYLYLTLDD
jgi:serine/threonine protein kinase